MLVRSRIYFDLSAESKYRKVFSYVQGMGGANDHPNVLEVRYCIKWFILDKQACCHIYTKYKCRTTKLYL